MIFQKRTTSLFAFFLLFFQFLFFSSFSWGQKAWQEPFQVHQLNRYSKGKMNGFFQLDNYTKNEKKSLEKAKAQILYQLIFLGVEANQDLRLAQILPIPFLEASASEVKDGESALDQFIQLQGQEAIVSIVLAEKPNSTIKDQVSWYIDVDMKRLAELLESAQLKKSLAEIFGVKLKAIYYPKDLFVDEYFRLVNEPGARTKYLEEFNLLKAEYAAQFEWLNILDYSKEITTALKENEQLKFETLNQIIVSTLKVDVQFEFHVNKVSKGMADQCSLVFKDAFDLFDIETPKTLTIAGGMNQSSLLAGYLQNRSDCYDEVVQLANSIYSKITEAKSHGRTYELRLKINPRLNIHLTDMVVIDNENYPLIELIEQVLERFAYQSRISSAGNPEMFRFVYAGMVLMRENKNFQSALNQKMKETCGYQFDFEFSGNNMATLVLTDLTKEERDVKMMQEFEKIQKSTVKNDLEAFLKAYPDFSRISEVQVLLQKVLDNEIYMAYQTAKSGNSFDSYRTFLLAYKDVVNSEDSIYSKALEFYNEEFVKLVKADSLQTSDYLQILKDNLIWGDEIFVLDPLYSSVLPANWKAINSLDEINRVIADLHRFIKNTFASERPDLLNHSIFTQLVLSTNEIESQNWTYPNLNVSHFLNGDTIPEAKTEEDWARASKEKKPAWSHFNNEASESYNKGKLYNWYALADPRGIVPKGYRIPSLDDYLQLAKNCGGVQVAAQKLKCPYAWGDDENTDGSDYSFFDLIPYGFHDARGFISGEDIAAFWTITSNNADNANYIYFAKGRKDMVTTFEASKSTGFSVRVIEADKEEQWGNSSEIIDLLALKRNQLILKEFSLLKNYEDIEKLLRIQLTKELELPLSYANDIDIVNVNLLYERFFNDEKVVKNGIYIKYFPFDGYRGCNQGDGYGGPAEDKIGFVNNVQNYVLYDDAMSYKGDMKDGSANGEGILVIIEDNEFGPAGRYEGQFENGYLVKGKITYKNKNVYTGQCQGNIPNGTGKMVLVSGKILEGDFKDGEYLKPFVCKQVQIGNQLWMAENLNVDHFRNGDEIRQAKSLNEWGQASAAWCYYDFNPANAKYGKLYNWYAVNDPRGLAPLGWHVPSRDEYAIMFRNYGQNNDISDFMKTALKAKSGWKDNGNNQIGFNGLAAGIIDTRNEFWGIGQLTYYWTSTCCLDFNSSATALQLDSYVCSLGDNNAKSSGYSVRCVKNAYNSHEIGDYFAGGIIFDLWVDANGEEHGLIVDLTDLKDKITWSNVLEAEVGKGAQSNNSGLANSNAVISQRGHQLSAASLCLNSTNGGQDDWYLPSIDEMQKLFNQFSKIQYSLANTPGAQTLTTQVNSDDYSKRGYFYWLSTEYPLDNTIYRTHGAYVADFGSMSTRSREKAETNGVRAIRRF